jgi:hypothetical protein
VEGDGARLVERAQRFDGGEDFHTVVGGAAESAG